jgi:Domain of unknown function (DUF3883)
MGFLMYGWDRGWRDYEAQGLGGKPMDHAASDGFTRHHLEIGDTVYVVAQRKRRMILIGRLPVDTIVSRRTAERHLGRKLVDKREHVLAEVPTSVVHFDREVPEEIVRHLRTVRDARITFSSENEYILANTALQPMVWLDTGSARALDTLLIADHPGEVLEDLVIGRRPGPASAAMRRAVESRAMERVVEHFREAGWTVVDVSADHPYDLHCTRDGDYLCVEVKGSVGAAARVNLTANEVRNAHDEHPRTALAIVRNVDLDLSDKEPIASGGELVVRSPWRVEKDALEPCAYYYTPPP